MMSRMTVGSCIAALALCSLVACSETARPAARTLETGVDQAALRADIAPYVQDWLSALGSSTPAKDVEVGRPYGCFTVRKGPRLEFVDYWEVPIVTGTKYWAMAGVRREGDVYVIIGMGLAELAALLGERENIPSVSSALEQGRAGLLRPSNYTGELLGYEVDGPSYPANIRVQLLGAGSSFFAGVDASVDGFLDASLAEINGALP